MNWTVLFVSWSFSGFNRFTIFACFVFSRNVRTRKCSQLFHWSPLCWMIFMGKTFCLISNVHLQQSRSFKIKFNFDVCIDEIMRMLFGSRFILLNEYTSESSMNRQRYSQFKGQKVQENPEKFSLCGHPMLTSDFITSSNVELSFDCMFDRPRQCSCGVSSGPWAENVQKSSVSYETVV